MKYVTCTRVLAVVAGCTVGASAFADDFYQGKQLRLVVGSDAGGGYDAYARLLARHWTDHIPGQPTIVVQNMPGASSMRALNEVANNAPKDGTVVAAVQNNIAFEPLLNISGSSENARFDPLALTWIGAATKDTTIALVWHGSAIHTIQDAMKRPANTGASGPATSTSITARIFNSAIGTRFNVINGYKSQTEMNLAIERGELDGVVGIQYVSIATGKPDWIAGKKIRIIAQIGQEKHPDLPDVPLFRDLIQSTEGRQEADLAFASLSMGRPLVAPGGVPADRVKVLRDSFIAAYASPTLRADAAKMKLEVIPMRGEDVHALIAAQYATPKSVVERVKAMLSGDKT
ncbi:MAG: Bug family tripartite tricarboxylate transporter substrate binding protein [Gemmatimonas sp.]